MSNYTINHLRELESEAIFVIREVAAQFEKPALLFSGGKDSILMTHLAKKAFYPARIPFPLIHIDTGHNFPETIEFRDRLVNNLGVTLIVGSVQEAIDKGMVKEETGINASRNSLQIVTLLDTLEKHKIDAAMGVLGEMKKRLGQKNVSFHIATNLDNGTQKTNDLNCGISLMVKKIMGNILEYFQYLIGQKWMFGSILN